MAKYNIKNGLIVDEIINLFEKESLCVQTIKDMLKVMRKIINIGVIYFIIICVIQRYAISALIFVLTASLLVIAYIINSYGKISYERSKKLGGKRYYIFARNPENKSITSHNRKLMQKNEIKILKKILKDNKLNNVDCMKEIRAYLMHNQKSDKLDESEFWKMIIGVYAIPITFGIINIYTAICNNIELTENIVNIGYIIIAAMTVVGIIYIIYCVSRIKRMSITNTYTYPRLVNILTDLILIESKQ